MSIKVYKFGHEREGHRSNIGKNENLGEKLQKRARIKGHGRVQVSRVVQRTEEFG